MSSNLDSAILLSCKKEPCLSWTLQIVDLTCLSPHPPPRRGPLATTPKSQSSPSPKLIQHSTSMAHGPTVWFRLTADAQAILEPDVGCLEGGWADSVTTRAILGTLELGKHADPRGSPGPLVPSETIGATRLQR
jgi:hypothetical protein